MSLEQALAYARRVAADGTRQVEDCPERAKLLELREALFAGPDRGDKARKRAREALWENRACSPVLFDGPAGGAASPAVRRFVALASRVRLHQWRRHDEPRVLLHQQRRAGEHSRGADR